MRDLSEKIGRKRVSSDAECSIMRYESGYIMHGQGAFCTSLTRPLSSHSMNARAYYSHRDQVILALPENKMNRISPPSRSVNNVQVLSRCGRVSHGRRQRAQTASHFTGGDAVHAHLSLGAGGSEPPEKRESRGEGTRRLYSPILLSFHFWIYCTCVV